MVGKLVAAGLFCVAMNAQAGFFDGNSLVKDMQEWEKYERKDPLANNLVTGVFMGYVAGVADAYDDIIVCPPTTQTSGNCPRSSLGSSTRTRRDWPSRPMCWSRTRCCNPFPARRSKASSGSPGGTGT